MKVEDGDVIVGIDVGKGTEDVLIHQVGSSFENSIQLVLPSMTQLITERIRKYTGKELRIAGDLMAGEPWHKLVYDRDVPVYMTKSAAMSLKYDLDYVRTKGITVLDEINDPNIILSDVGWARLKGILESSDISPDQIRYLLLCAQEHGHAPKGESSKDFRMKQVWGDQPSLESRLMKGDQVSPAFPRFQSLVNAALREFPHLDKDTVFIMDSAAAVLLGAINPDAEELVVNIGNGHVSAIHHRFGDLLYVYEGHTGRFHAEEFLADVSAVYQGTLTHQDVVAKGGHGLKIFNLDAVLHNNPPSSLVVLGPNRHKLPSDLCTYVHPIGNMMMAGPFGLIRALYCY